MIMVIFGAGASYDSIPHYPPPGTTLRKYEIEQYRLPLADQLFENRSNFVKFLSEFPECHPIVPYLRNRRGGQSVEQILQGLQAEAEGYPDRKKQLAAIRYYLHSMLWFCGDQWIEKSRGVTNHLTLLDQIERWRNGKEVCLVTFNYDLLLENALMLHGVKIRTLDGYIKNHYKLIKLHGSVNWMRKVYAGPFPGDGASNLMTARKYIRHASALDVSKEYDLISHSVVSSGEGYKETYFPAIAIPVERKIEFECPEDHLNTLRSMVHKVDKILVIGWRASEQPFLELLAGNLQTPVKVFVVAGGKAQSEETQQRLAGSIRGYYETSAEGFTGFIINREADRFLGS